MCFNQSYELKIRIMEKRLISMVDFVKKVNSLTTTELIREYPKHFIEYRPSLHKDMVRYLLSIDAIKWKMTKELMQFLNQPLNLGMFVPAIEVDGKLEVFTDPNNGYDFDTYNLAEALEQYQQAKDKTLFKGFDSVRYVNEIIIIKHGNYVGKFHISCKIEMLIELKFLKFTDNGLKESGI